MPMPELVVPCFCPNCKGLMKGKSTNTYYDYGCCIDCYIYFLEGRPEKIEAWKKGWRPSEDETRRMVESFRF